jgi:hypothetical protein
MEPHATIAAWDADKLTVWTATQGIGGAQVTLAGQFGIDEDDVRVICPYLGATPFIVMAGLVQARPDHLRTNSWGGGWPIRTFS